MTAPTTVRPALEVADVIRQYGTAFLTEHGSGLAPVQRQALRDLANCRTAALGGHVERCLDCGHERIAYNSCRNRHCPKCQALARAHWLDRQAQHLLPVEYHHVVFTLPAELGPLALANPELVYDLLLRSAAATLHDVAANPKRLGATVGVLTVLHTWGQNLSLLLAARLDISLVEPGVTVRLISVQIDVAADCPYGGLCRRSRYPNTMLKNEISARSESSSLPRTSVNNGATVAWATALARRRPRHDQRFHGRLDLLFGTNSVIIPPT